MRWPYECGKMSCTPALPSSGRAGSLRRVVTTELPSSPGAFLARWAAAASFSGEASTVRHDSAGDPARTLAASATHCHSAERGHR